MIDKYDKPILDVIEKIDLQKITQQEFVDIDIQSRFKLALSKWTSDIFVLKKQNKIISFCFLMKEDLKCGFLHYHIQNEFKPYFSQKYPIINRKTNQILYIYTSQKFRKQGMATSLLNFIFKDLKNRNYYFLWLKKETNSNIYWNLEFFNFVDILDILKIKDEFMEDYKKKCNFDEKQLVRRYGDIRLVKIL